MNEEPKLTAAYCVFNSERVFLVATMGDEPTVFRLQAKGLKSNSRFQPPRAGEFLLYFFLPRKDRRTIPGDLCEEYFTIMVPKFGERVARIWYWKQVLSSIWPVLSGRLWWWIERAATLGKRQV
jgi:hypothetical protein